MAQRNPNTRNLVSTLTWYRHCYVIVSEHRGLGPGLDAGDTGQLDIAFAFKELIVQALAGIPPGARCSLPPGGLFHCQAQTFLCSLTPSNSQLLPKTIRSPRPRCAHPQEVRSQAPSQPVHDIEEKEAADGVEEPTWKRKRARPGPDSPLPARPFTPRPCPLLIPNTHSTFQDWWSWSPWL